MDSAQVANALREAVMVVIKLGSPLLVLSMLVGILVAIFQAVTQIHEQSLAFIFKVMVVVLVFLVGGGWMLTILQEYTLGIFTLIRG